VHLVQFIHMLENPVQLAGKFPDLFIRKAQVGQIGHVTNFLLRKLQAVSLFRERMYSLRKPGTSMPAASSAGAAAPEHSDRCGPRRGGAIRNSTSPTRPSPRLSAS